MNDEGYQPPEGFLTMSQAMVRLRVSKPTINRMVHRGDLETFRDPRNRRVKLVKVEDIDRLSRPVSEGKAAA